MKHPHQRQTVEISHPDKVFFPRDGITKADLAAYYEEIAATMLPHVRDRAVVMHRFPDDTFVTRDSFRRTCRRTSRSGSRPSL